MRRPIWDEIRLFVEFALFLGFWVFVVLMALKTFLVWYGGA